MLAESRKRALSVLEEEGTELGSVAEEGEEGMEPSTQRLRHSDAGEGCLQCCTCWAALACPAQPSAAQLVPLTWPFQLMYCLSAWRWCCPCWWWGPNVVMLLMATVLLLLMLLLLLLLALQVA
jgi:hypothetical protein